MEKIIKGIECCDDQRCYDCPYEHDGCIPVLMHDALHKFKEQSSIVDEIFADLRKFARKPFPEARIVLCIKESDLEALENKYKEAL